MCFGNGFRTWKFGAFDSWITCLWVRHKMAASHSQDLSYRFHLPFFFFCATTSPTASVSFVTVDMYLSELYLSFSLLLAVSSVFWHPVPAGSGWTAVQIFSACFPGFWIYFSLVYVQEGSLMVYSEFPCTKIPFDLTYQMSLFPDPGSAPRSEYTKSADLNMSKTLVSIQKEHFPRQRRILFPTNICATSGLRRKLQLIQWRWWWTQNVFCLSYSSWDVEHGCPQLQGWEALTKQKDRKQDKLVPESFVTKETFFFTCIMRTSPSAHC